MVWVERRTGRRRHWRRKDSEVLTCLPFGWGKEHVRVPLGDAAEEGGKRSPCVRHLVEGEIGRTRRQTCCLSSSHPIASLCCTGVAHVCGEQEGRRLKGQRPAVCGAGRGKSKRQPKAKVSGCSIIFSLCFSGGGALLLVPCYLSKVGHGLYPLCPSLPS